ncbi:hypothetical protein JHK85_040255 [Glycine max]|nr:hypothetical protein JHK86_039678 [Glycine max]KAG4965280.1 hypothetical protein JHK85_040255 [Glycine max]
MLRSFSVRELRDFAGERELNFKRLKVDSSVAFSSLAFHVCFFIRLVFQGDGIHVVCKQDQLKSWKADLKENSTYVIHNFKVLKNDGQFKFLAYLNDFEDARPIVILLTHARIKEGQGFLIQDLRSNKFWRLLAEPVHIFQDREIVCVTVDMITKIVMDNHSWCYPACSQCHKKTNIDVVPFTCGCGKHNDKPVLRYRIEVMVKDKDKDTKFLLWARECAELIGQSVDEVNRLKMEGGDVDLDASPQALDRLLGCVLAFKVKVQPKFGNAVVLKYSNELDLINVVLDMLADTEPFSKMDSLVVECTDPTQAESQFVSVTIDHDPLLRVPLTPTKRLSTDELDDKARSCEISPAQLSSNKLARPSATE